MRNRYAYLSLLSALLFSPTVHAEQCGLKQIVAFDLPAGDDSPAISLLVENTPQAFAVSFSTPYSGLPENLVEKLHLRKMPGDIIGMWVGGHQVTHLAVGTIQIGPIRGREFTTFVIPKEVESDVAVIGADILTKFDVELDLAHAKLNLFSHEHCKGQVVYWTRAFGATSMSVTKFGTFSFKMLLDGKPVDAIIDVESEHTNIPLGLIKSLFDLDEHSLGMVALPSQGDGTMALYRYPFKSLSNGPLSINNPLIEIVDNPFMHCVTAPYREFFEEACGKTSLTYLRLGRNVLRALRLYLAYDEKTLYLSSADAH